MKEQPIVRMTKEQRDEITEISKKFADGFKPDIPTISGSGWLIVDPLSVFLNTAGWNNKLMQLPATNNHPLILVMVFDDGSKLIPAGSDLGNGATDWLWI